MIGLPTQLIGAAGVISLGISLVPEALGLASAQPVASVAQEARAAKGDRLAAGQVQDRMTVTTVELVGVSRTVVIFRDEGGNVLFRSDPLTNTTLIARDVELPVITVKQEEKSPILQKEPVEHREGAQPPAAPGRKPRTVGCEGAVSPLAKGSSGSPSLCLAALGLEPSSRS
jgi:hypothetical protein